MIQSTSTSYHFVPIHADHVHVDAGGGEVCIIVQHARRHKPQRHCGVAIYVRAHAELCVSAADSARTSMRRARSYFSLLLY